MALGRLLIKRRIQDRDQLFVQTPVTAIRHEFRDRHTITFKLIDRTAHVMDGTKAFISELPTPPFLEKFDCVSWIYGILVQPHPAMLIQCGI